MRVLSVLPLLAPFLVSVGASVLTPRDGDAATCLRDQAVCRTRVGPRCCLGFQCRPDGLVHRCQPQVAAVMERAADAQCIPLAKKCTPGGKRCCPGGVCTSTGGGTHRCLDDGAKRSVDTAELFARNDAAQCVKPDRVCKLNGPPCCPSTSLPYTCQEAGGGVRKCLQRPAEKRNVDAAKLFARDDAAQCIKPLKQCKTGGPRCCPSPSLTYVCRKDGSVKKCLPIEEKRSVDAAEIFARDDAAQCVKPGHKCTLNGPKCCPSKSLPYTCEVAPGGGRKCLQTPPEEKRSTDVADLFSRDTDQAQCVSQKCKPGGPKCCLPLVCLKKNGGGHECVDVPPKA